MSRKVGYEFSPLPKKWHAAWADLSMPMRGLRASLFELADGGPITVDGDWLTSLCKQMNVGGRERPNVRKSLLDLQARGVLAVDGQTVSICFRPDSQLHRPVADLSAIGRGSDIPIDSTPQNDSTTVRQKERREENRREKMMSACAPERATAPEPRPPIDTSKLQQRPEDVGFRFVASLLGRSPFDIAPVGSFPREYAHIGSKPAEERERVRVAVEATQYFIENPAWCDAKKLAADWPKLLADRPKPVLKQLVATPREQLEKARERLQDAAKTLRIIEGLPWFDKEKPGYPGRLAQATADVSRLRGELAKLESGFTRPAVAS